MWERSVKSPIWAARLIAVSHKAADRIQSTSCSGLWQNIHIICLPVGLLSEKKRTGVKASATLTYAPA